MMPKFFTSEYFVPEPDNWHLKEGAPPEVVEEFEAYMKEHGYQEENRHRSGCSYFISTYYCYDSTITTNFFVRGFFSAPSMGAV